MRKSYRRRMADEDQIHEEYRQVWNTYSEAIRNTKENHWKEWLEKLDEDRLWAANRLVSREVTDGGRNRIPTLTMKDPITKQVIKEARTNVEK